MGFWLQSAGYLMLYARAPVFGRPVGSGISDQESENSYICFLCSLPMLLAREH